MMPTQSAAPNDGSMTFAMQELPTAYAPFANVKEAVIMRRFRTLVRLVLLAEPRPFGAMRRDENPLLRQWIEATMRMVLGVETGSGHYAPSCSNTAYLIGNIPVWVGRLPAPSIGGHIVETTRRMPSEFVGSFRGVGPAFGDIPRTAGNNSIR